MRAETSAHTVHTGDQMVSILFLYMTGRIRSAHSMPTFTQLPSGRANTGQAWRHAYKAATFDRNRDAEDWGGTVEGQAKMVAVPGYARPPATQRSRS